MQNSQLHTFTFELVGNFMVYVLVAGLLLQPANLRARRGVVT